MVKSQEKTVKLGTIFLKRVCHFFKKLFSAFEEGATELNIILVTIK
jgi:type I restriction-modification system DNA methylase subunit